MAGKIVVARVAAGAHEQVDQGPVGPVADDDDAIDRLPDLPGGSKDRKQGAVAPLRLAPGRAVGLEHPFGLRPAGGGHGAADLLRPVEPRLPARNSAASGRQHPGGRIVLDRIGRRPGTENTHGGRGAEAEGSGGGATGRIPGPWGMPA